MATCGRLVASTASSSHVHAWRKICERGASLFVPYVGYLRAHTKDAHTKVSWLAADKAVRPKRYTWMSRLPNPECWSSNPACVASRSFPSWSRYTTTMHLYVLIMVAKDAFPVCCVTEVVHGGCTGATYHFTVAPSGLPRGRTWCDGKWLRCKIYEP
ncbi:hypothetical protein KVT40_006793 [Elsinoe batatas]|uniref:Uncharacterized protein n=1 Tax=Elsinoe batatas TaxID=2601811 RepID=A0A8K0KX97_9PEZI|nr:hypothetical protein KVT40_006793 [Elsinoe batatas]